MQISSEGMRPILSLKSMDQQTEIYSECAGNYPKDLVFRTDAARAQHVYNQGL